MAARVFQFTVEITITIALVCCLCWYIYYQLKRKNVFKHLKKIFIHKWWVFYYCCRCGIIWQGIKHDMSKFSPTEFIESIKYYQGNRSPIDACKEENGYSMAWQHHKGRNMHHYEHWTDNYDSGTTYIIMPFKYALEMLCDYIGAARAYMGKDFTFAKEHDWWVNIKEPTVQSMHWVIKNFMNDALCDIANNEKRFNKKYLKSIYDHYIELYDQMLIGHNNKEEE